MRIETVEIGPSADAAADAPAAAGARPSASALAAAGGGSITMDYFKFGRGEEPLVILLGLSVQSVMDSADAIAGAYRLLADDFTIYVFDRRKDLPALEADSPAPSAGLPAPGSGIPTSSAGLPALSAGLPDPYSIYDMARDTATALRALRLPPVYLLGMSQGGMIAMTIAIEQPDLVRKLALCSTSARTKQSQFKTVENWIKLAKAGKREDLYLAFGEALYPQDVFEGLRELLIENAKSVTDEELARFVILAEGMRGFDVTDDLEKIKCPVFVVGSKDDRVLGSDEALLIADHLSGRKDFSLHLYDHYGHAAYDTAPDFKQRVLDFLKS